MRERIVESSSAGGRSLLDIFKNAFGVGMVDGTNSPEIQKSRAIGANEGLRWEDREGLDVRSLDSCSGASGIHVHQIALIFPTLWDGCQGASPASISRCLLVLRQRVH